ncbi:hypothetical protein FRC18_006867 [Serendipita sp. 400]|nr:hypothetical protein FRC18_006867 [Serendipita sp. 400]
MLRRRINGLTTFPPLASTRIGSHLLLDPFRNFHGRLYSEGNINGKKEGEQLEIVEKLREWQETAKKNGSERLAIWKSSAEQNLASLGSKLNQLTGYELVEALKRQVVEQGLSMRNLPHGPPSWHMRLPCPSDQWANAR